MEAKEIIKIVGMVVAVALPFFNIPLIVRVIKRKSSKDISLVWAIGVWVGIILMAPSGFTSTDIVWKLFNITNIFFFTGVLIVTLKYRHG